MRWGKLAPLAATGAICLTLCACGPQLSYRAVSDLYAPDPANSLRFSLQKPAIALQEIGGTAKTTPVTCTIAKFDACIRKIAPPTVSSVAVSETGSYLAVPKNDFFHKPIGRTTISGTTVSTSDVLYSKININYTNNVPSIINAAGAGAATGALFGPAGIAVGAAAGVAVGVAAGEEAYIAEFHPPPQWVKKAVCQAYQSDFIWADLPQTPTLNLPVVLQPSYLPPPSKTGETTACWQPVPNSALGTSSSYDPTRSPRKPEAGDGWFYRITFAAALSKEAQAYIQPTTTFLPSQIPSTQFPYSFCRSKARLEITWWTQLESNKPKASVITIDQIADPDWVQVVDLPYTGAITFNRVCGASASSSAGPDLTATWNAINTQMNAIIKAQGSSSSKSSGSK